MRLLVDSCVWPPAVDQLRSAGHDVNSVSEWGSDPGDEEILQCSVNENRVLITLDKDFGELVFVMGLAHQGIIRLVDIRARDHGKSTLQVLAKHGNELGRGAIVVAEKNRLRIRRPEQNT